MGGGMVVPPFASWCQLVLVNPGIFAFAAYSE